MKPKLQLALSLAAALIFQPGGLLAEADPPSPVAGQKAAVNNPESDLKALVAKIREKLQTGKTTVADFPAELKEFDVLLDKYKSQKTDAVAQILLMKALLYVQIFDEPEKGIALARKLKTDFPETKPGQDADKMIAQINQAAEAKKVQAGLVEGKQFPEFHEKDLAGKPLSIGSYKGKVLLVDFWATWCGPCVGELPNVLETYKKYHPAGFEIVGISLDKQEDADKLAEFLKDKNVTWRQFFDGGGWQNKLAAKYGITSIPATFLLDRQGKIIGKDLRGEDLGTAVGKALAPN